MISMVRMVGKVQSLFGPLLLPLVTVPRVLEIEAAGLHPLLYSVALALVGWNTKCIRLHLFVYYVRNYVDFVQNCFEVGCFSLAIVRTRKFTANVVFYVFVSQKSRQWAFNLLILFLINRIFANLARIFLTPILPHLLLRLQTRDLLQSGLFSIGRAL